MNRTAAALLVACACLTAGGAAATGQQGPVYVMRGGDLSGWESREFNGRTDYERVMSDGRAAVRAVSRGTASGMYRRQRIDLERTPVLRWWWRVPATVGSPDETRRSGDDYAARVYAVAGGRLLAWRARAVNYVWASRQPAGAAWPNAYTGRSMMMAVRSGEADAGTWVQERRNVREDFRRLFGEDVRYLDAVAIMTDSDDTGGRAEAWYGEIWFTTE